MDSLLVHCLPEPATCCLLSCRCQVLVCYPEVESYVVANQMATMRQMSFQ